MSFLKDFKDELSQAVNELVSIDEAEEEKKAQEVLDDEADTVKSEEAVKNFKKKKNKKSSAQKNNRNRKEDINAETGVDMAVLNEFFGENQQDNQEERAEVRDERLLNEEIPNEEVSAEEMPNGEEFDFDNIDISDYLEETTAELAADVTENALENMEENSIEDSSTEKEDIDNSIKDNSAEKSNAESITIEDIKEENSKEYSIEKEDENLSEEFSIKDIREEEVHNEEELDEMLKDNKERTKAALRGEAYGESSQETYASRADEESSLVAEEIAEITKGTMIEGNIVSEGSVNVHGKIKGNVACRGKLMVSGTIVGSSRAADVITNNAKINGDVTSDGALKIGNGTVIIGNIYGSSAVIAGAVQGDIDIHGPVVIDGTAVIQGNIRSRSVQINNGAAIEGMISQCYAEIDYTALFDKTFSN